MVSFKSTFPSLYLVRYRIFSTRDFSDLEVARGCYVALRVYTLAQEICRRDPVSSLRVPPLDLVHMWMLNCSSCAQEPNAKRQDAVLQDALFSRSTESRAYYSILGSGSRLL